MYVRTGVEEAIGLITGEQIPVPGSRPRLMVVRHAPHIAVGWEP
jgi:hypothetical protein